MKFAILLIFLFNIFVFANNTKEVLLIHSYNKGNEWSDDISIAIEKEFKKTQELNINLTTVYMDTKKISTQKYIDSLFELYKIQFQKRKFDLIMVSDNYAFDFIIKNHEKLFLKIPVLFCGINNFDKAFLEENNMKKYMTGVVEDVDIKKNFDLILRLHPNIKKLIIINDYSRTGQAIRRDLNQVIPIYKNKIKKIEYIQNIDMLDLKNKLKNENENTVIFLVLFFQDKSGKLFTYKEAINNIKSSSDLPIYSLWDFYISHGVLGGLLSSATAQGEEISKMALKILNGTQIKDIKIIEKSPNRYIFDYKELKRLNIDIEKYLDNYIIVNKPFSFYDEYKLLVNIIIIVFIIFIILIILMRQNIQKRKIVQISLSNQIKFNTVLLDTMPNPIYYKNKQGEFLGCNKAFANLVKTKKEKVIGKTSFHFFTKIIAEKNAKIDKNLLESKGSNISELTLHLDNNKIKYYILTKAVYENEDRSVGGIVCIMDDMTERIQQKQFLIQQSKLAEMGDMIAAIAHQWNEPLVELSAQVQDIQLSFLLKELEEIQMQNFVKDCMIQIKYMSKTLNDFRNFLKPSTKKILFGIRKSMDEILEILSKQIYYSNINLHLNYKEENKNILIFGYENEFKQVLLNLINNAKIKITEKNKDSSRKGNIYINIKSDDKYNIIEVIDDAGNIPDDIIKLIFDPYFTTKKNGTGIGLYMAKVIIEDKMYGKIDVKNDNDKVVFTLKLQNYDYNKLSMQKINTLEEKYENIIT